MNLRHYFLLLTILLNASLVCSQEQEDSFEDYHKNKSVDNITFFKPTIGLGVGILSFHGDIGSGSFKNHLTPRIGYNILASTRINDYFDLSLEALFGKLEVNERSVGRNLNFQSEIRSGGAKIYYNFGHFLKPQRFIEPFLSFGLESLEFLSKTDLFDANGNRYHYWNDGSIRDIDQNAPNAAAAVYLQRDYNFETDIRESNFDGFGRYSERTLSI
nr:hypothetical protein [Bacteroidota bacterium]